MAFVLSPFEAPIVSITGYPFCEYISMSTVLSIVRIPFVPSARILIAVSCNFCLFTTSFPSPEMVRFPPYPSPQIKIDLTSFSPFTLILKSSPIILATRLYSFIFTLFSVRVLVFSLYVTPFTFSTLACAKLANINLSVFSEINLKYDGNSPLPGPLAPNTI